MTKNSDPECLFCKIAGKKIGAAIIYEDKNTLAFLDIRPKAPGHALVMPKSHASKIVDLADSELAPLFGTVRQAAKMLEAALSPDGLTIGINQGKASGQEVPHLHIHLLPRFLNDGGGSIHAVVDNPPKESVEEMAERIRKSG